MQKERNKSKSHLGDSYHNPFTRTLFTCNRAGLQPRFGQVHGFWFEMHGSLWAFQSSSKITNLFCPSGVCTGTKPNLYPGQVGASAVEKRAREKKVSEDTVAESRRMHEDAAAAKVLQGDRGRALAEMNVYCDFCWAKNCN